jgi:hypothetical protein
MQITGNRTQQARLTIRVSKNTLSFSVVDREAEHQLIYEPYTVKSGVSIAANLRQAFSESDLLQRGYTKVRVYIDSPILLVPIEEFHEEDLPVLYQHAFTGHNGDVILHKVQPNLNVVLDREEELSQGDILMIVKNNYYWMEEERKKLSEERRVKSEEFNCLANHKVQSSNLKAPSNDIPAFLANGDRAKVLKVRRRIDLYGFRFATLLLQFPDYGNYELEATVLLDTLTSEAPALTHEQQEQLFHQIEEDYQDVPLKADRMKAIRQDQFYNALQVKFAYAVTCHKAQGGQWAHVYVDQGYMTDDMLTPDYIHWLYTAFTRATEMLYLVNWPETQIETN